MEHRPPFEIKDHDSRFYQERLASFLPDRIIDIHTHVWLSGSRGPQAESAPSRLVTWPDRVAAEQTVIDLLDTYRMMLPGKRVTPLIFGMSVLPSDDLEAGNQYVISSARRHRLPALVFASPRWDAGELEDRIKAGGFVGAKVYLGLADSSIRSDDICIYDFLPRHQLEVLDRNGWLAMLHIPRSGRLKDPVNLQQMLEIDERYPNASVVIAHVGRAYCQEDLGTAFSVLPATKNLVFDISANTNSLVFEELIRAMGPGRILFGSDLPIVRMRMRRICENGTYVNLVPKGLYGDVHGDRNMREVEGDEANALSFFLYEEIDALRKAAQRTALSDADIENIFHGNALRLLEKAGANFHNEGEEGTHE